MDENVVDAKTWINKSIAGMADADETSDHIKIKGLQAYRPDSWAHILKVIIPEAKKQFILKDLTSRGITKSFIFPTLENGIEDIVSEFSHMTR